MVTFLISGVWILHAEINNLLSKKLLIFNEIFKRLHLVKNVKGAHLPSG